MRSLYSTSDYSAMANAAEELAGVSGGADTTKPCATTTGLCRYVDRWQPNHAWENTTHRKHNP